VSDIYELREAMRRFSEERDWTRFHDPKSLTLALVGEVGELAELLQWLPVDGINVLVREPRLQERLGEELADVLLYLLRLSDVVGVDLAAEAAKKLASNESRFPADGHRGVAPERH
jgi:dCTP diphosphatase